MGELERATVLEAALKAAAAKLNHAKDAAHPAYQRALRDAADRFQADTTAALAQFGAPANKHEDGA